MISIFTNDPNIENCNKPQKSIRFNITNIAFSILENKLTTQASSDGEQAIGLATNHFLSKLAIAMTFFPFFLRA